MARHQRGSNPPCRRWRWSHFRSCSATSPEVRAAPTATEPRDVDDFPRYSSFSDAQRRRENIEDSREGMKEELPLLRNSVATPASVTSRSKTNSTCFELSVTCLGASLAVTSSRLVRCRVVVEERKTYWTTIQPDDIMLRYRAVIYLIESNVKTKCANAVHFAKNPIGSARTCMVLGCLRRRRMA